MISIPFSRSEVLHAKEGICRAAEIMDSGKPVMKLRSWVKEQNTDPGNRLEWLESMLEIALA
jgi:hypothetical protein